MWRRQVTETHTHIHKQVRIWRCVREQLCPAPLNHSIHSEPKGSCLSVSGWARGRGVGDTHSRGIPSPKGHSGVFFPLEPLKIEVGLILIHTHRHAHTHTRTHIRAHTHTHTHTHAHTHTYTNAHSHTSAIQTQSPAIQCVSSSMQEQKMGGEMEERGKSNRTQINKRSYKSCEMKHCLNILLAGGVNLNLYDAWLTIKTMTALRRCVQFSLWAVEMARATLRLLKDRYLNVQQGLLKFTFVCN